MTEYSGILLSRLMFLISLGLFGKATLEFSLLQTRRGPDLSPSEAMRLASTATGASRKWKCALFGRFDHEPSDPSQPIGSKHVPVLCPSRLPHTI